MPIPDYQTLMRPVLVALDTHGDMSQRQLVDLIRHNLGVTVKETYYIRLFQR